MAGMTMPAGAGVAASHCWNRVRKPGQLINMPDFDLTGELSLKIELHMLRPITEKSTQWQWASFVSVLETDNMYYTYSLTFFFFFFFFNFSDDWSVYTQSE